MNVELREMWSADQMDALVSGAIDVGFAHYVTIAPKIAIRFAAMHRRGATGKFLAPFLERIERSAFTPVASDQIV